MANAVWVEGERESMLESALVLLLCALMALLGVLVVGWMAVSGRLFTLDGLALAAICLTLAAAFAANVAWSFYKGEVKAILDHYLKRPDGGSAGSPPKS